MRKSSIWSIFAIALISLPLIVACSSDDDSNGGGKKVDGVNVTTGRKLLELEISCDNRYYSFYSGKYKIEYDPNGRLNRVLYTNYNYKYDDNGEIQFLASGEYSEVAIFDYDLKSVTIKYPSERFNYITNFKKKKKGYINQISNYTLKYNTNGYLTDIDGAEGFSSLTYENNDIIKAAISPLAAGNMTLIYVNYDKEKEGDLYFKIKRIDNGKYAGQLNLKYMIAIIAYQSGLFGKVMNTVLNLKDETETSALFEYETERYSPLIGKVKFVCQ